MAKFSKAFRGARKGEIYPTDFAPGDECPPELERAAQACGVLEQAARPAETKGRAKK